MKMVASLNLKKEVFWCLNVKDIFLLHLNQRTFSIYEPKREWLKKQRLLSLSLSLSHSHTRTHVHTLTLPFSSKLKSAGLAFPFRDWIEINAFVSLLWIFLGRRLLRSQFISLSLSLSHTHTNNHTLSLSLTHTHTHSLSLSTGFGREWFVSSCVAL